ncbi:MAG: alpha/beta hydrolase-fold protein [Gemmataceae bacterium]
MKRAAFAYATILFWTLSADAAGLSFKVKLDPSLVGTPPQSGRLVVALSSGRGSPRYSDTGPPGGPVLGIDVEQWTAEKEVTLDGSCLFFPLASVNQLPAGEYSIQATFFTNRDLTVPNAPGNCYSRTIRAKLDPAAGTSVNLTLTEKYKDEKPADTKTVKYVHLPSKLLSDFHGRPMVYRFTVVLPPNYEKDVNQKYALLVHIGGFGSRYTGGRGLRPDPRFVQILLDGAGPYGDPYQVNSANNGPYGDALTTEVIPYVEEQFRCLKTNSSRFTTGGSTGGWVSLALQLYYPDVFNGCWSQCPDGVDFRSLELINIYRDENAYVNRFGFERPSKRTIEGDTIFHVRHESKIERVLGRGNRWELGGLDWASWNAVYGPRGADGLPKPLWNGETGQIDKSVRKHWEKYDLRLVMERNWKTLGPKLAGGKVHIWVGEADDYFLNNGVHHFKTAAESLSDPPFDGSIQIEIRKPHTSGGWSQVQMMNEMAKRAGL